MQYEISDPDGLTSTGTYTVTITAPVNGPPTARDDSTPTNQGSPVDVLVLNNDEDPDGDQLTVELTSGPASQQGSAVVRPDGKTVRFTPAVGFSGQATFQYRAVDSKGTKSNTATVRVTVIACAQGTPITNDSSTFTPYGTPIALDLLAPGQLDFVLDVTDVQGGQVANGPSAGTVIFTPAAGNNEFGSVRYTVTNSCDVSRSGSVSIDVNRVPRFVGGSFFPTVDVPVIVTAAAIASDDPGEPLTIRAATPSAPSATVAIVDEGRALTFSSSAAGLVTVNVTVKDPGGLETSGTLTFDVQLPANVPPTDEECQRDAEPERDSLHHVRRDRSGGRSGWRAERVADRARHDVGQPRGRHRRDDLGCLVARRTTGHDHARQPCQRPRGDLLPRHRRARRRERARRHPDRREPTPVGATRQ